MPQRTVVHIHTAFKDDAARIDAKRIALLKMIVDAGAQQIVRRGDGMHIAGEMEVDILHGHGLRVSAAGRSALNAENRAEGGLT